ncbi:MarR family transcriptional regulator [Paractinoplanes abujensis]|uniref:DNA-binding MarR family transcriptional regulator n=1 Tax=Paractinoplanes abujensis TaxID=882441 RepID=A0A7W7CKK3_9ACTN|nr:helix-turn-helix domain-containing protein [Actinoplanes abujensis]MBB4690197.1 DNA-binding MarR family transcriptional regulator [Actinoplanes abujensis]GID20962.1 MarR family transcriptional regulator [Actinoplanes abujensis]
MDLLDSNHWSDLHALLAELDQEIAALYTDAGIEGMRTRFVGPLIALHRFGPMTIRQLAERRGVTHSAMSQTAAAMTKAGFVETVVGADARTRELGLSARAREIMPFLVAEWRATEAAVRRLDAELPYSLTQVTADLRGLLETQPFAERLRACLS